MRRMLQKHAAATRAERCKNAARDGRPSALLFDVDDLLQPAHLALHAVNTCAAASSQTQKPRQHPNQPPPPPTHPSPPPITFHQNQNLLPRPVRPRLPLRNALSYHLHPQQLRNKFAALTQVLRCNCSAKHLQCSGDTTFSNAAGSLCLKLLMLAPLERAPTTMDAWLRASLMGGEKNE